MEEKYRDIMEELFYRIREDIYGLLDVEYGEIEDAIIALVHKVNKLGYDIYEDEISYNSNGREFKFKLG